MLKDFQAVFFYIKLPTIQSVIKQYRIYRCVAKEREKTKIVRRTHAKADNTNISWTENNYEDDHRAVWVGGHKSFIINRKEGIADILGAEQEPHPILMFHQVKARINYAKKHIKQSYTVLFEGSVVRRDYNWTFGHNKNVTVRRKLWLVSRPPNTNAFWVILVDRNWCSFVYIPIT